MSNSKEESTPSIWARVETENQDFMRAQLRMNIFQKLVAHVTQYARTHRIGRKELASLAGKSPAQVARCLNSPAQLQLDMISDMLLATGARLHVEIEPLADSANSPLCRFVITSAPAEYGMWTWTAPTVEIKARFYNTQTGEWEGDNEND